MDILPEEQQLLAIYRRLTPAGRQDLLNYAGTLTQNHSPDPVETEPKARQCTLQRKEERPETVKEPVFTE